ncbi:hypothetical protein BGX27_010512 [Mortierella sp. AM989]|nr:hypothetical protein BGX27_010512 [Mortierella sp. AM989]
MKPLNLDFEENSKLVASGNLKYKVVYFSMHFGGTNSRGILTYAGVNWTSVYPNWGTDKSNMPFEVVPALTVIHPDGKELVLAENVAIGIFLAKQFGLHGQNTWEEALINSFYSNSNTMIQESHLEKNHLNGHYVGNRTTLADIRITTLLDPTEKILGKERIATVINETKTPGIIKVRKIVESKPS